MRQMVETVWAVLDPDDEVVIVALDEDKAEEEVVYLNEVFGLGYRVVECQLIWSCRG